MRSTLYFVLSVDGLLIGLSVGVSDEFSLSPRFVPVARACVMQSMATVRKVPYLSLVTVFD